MPERFLGKSLGKYRVDELVGSGGFAWVYRAFDPELEIDVALKVLKPQFAGDPQVEQRFRREASTAAKLRHPNIVTIHAVGREGDAVYFAMDFLPDGLAQRLEAVAFLPEEAVVRVGIDVASALGFAHRQGVIHRDIKVDNILFDAHGNAVVADFGIARAVSGYPGQTGTNMVVGTPQYFAPEQARAKPLDGRADLYSLGITLFRAATGQLPFNGDDWYEVARQHVETEPPSPRSLNPALSPGFERVILRCLNKRPDDRPATGEALRLELAELLGPSPERGTLRARIASEEPTLVVDTRSIRLRRRISPALVASVLVLAIAAASIPVLVDRRGAGATPSTALPADVGLAGTATPPVTSIDSVIAPGSVRVPTDSFLPRGESTRTTTVVDSMARRARVTVTAPDGAVLTVDNIQVGAGGWRSDTLRPGAHEFTATLPGAPSECESARARRTETLRAGRTTTVALSPTACGIFRFAARPAGARYTLISVDGRVQREGTVPERDSTSIVVPPGVYRLSITERKCGPYHADSLVVAPDRTTRPQTGPIKLDCP